MDKSQIGLSGEFHTLAQLTQRGLCCDINSREHEGDR